MKNVPELRFPEYREEWEVKKLDEVVDFSKGKHLGKKDLTEKDGVPCILYGELYTKYGPIIDEVVSKTNVDTNKLKKGTKNQILIPSSGETTEDIATASALNINEDVYIGGDLNILTPKKEDGRFISLSLNGVNKWNVARFAQGKTVVHLYNNDLRKLQIKLPLKIEEQQKIGEFFSKLDRQIELEEQKLEKLEEQKKGYMQNIFAQKLYFKDENGNKYPDWTVKTLNEVFEVSKKRNKNNEYSHKDVLSVSREHGVINQIKYHGRSYAAKTVENYKIVKPHDLIYTKSPLKGAPYGIFKVTTEEGIISPLYAVYTSLNENITDFVSYYFEFNNITTHYLSKLVSKGAKNTINVTDEMALTGKVILPNSEKEVTQIVNFFNEIRELIKKQRKKIEGLKMRKQGFLQKMFV